MPSQLLRHTGAKEGLNVRPDGFVEDSEIMKHRRNATLNLNLDAIKLIVKQNPKRRSELDECCSSELHRDISYPKLMTDSCSEIRFLNSDQTKSVVTQPTLDFYR